MDKVVKYISRFVNNGSDKYVDKYINDKNIYRHTIVFNVSGEYDPNDVVNMCMATNEEMVNKLLAIGLTSPITLDILNDFRIVCAEDLAAVNDLNVLVLENINVSDDTSYKIEMSILRDKYSNLTNSDTIKEFNKVSTQKTGLIDLIRGEKIRVLPNNLVQIICSEISNLSKMNKLIKRIYNNKFKKHELYRKCVYKHMKLGNYVDENVLISFSKMIFKAELDDISSITNAVRDRKILLFKYFSSDPKIHYVFSNMINMINYSENEVKDVIENRRNLYLKYFIYIMNYSVKGIEIPYQIFEWIRGLEEQISFYEDMAMVPYNLRMLNVDMSHKVNETFSILYNNNVNKGEKLVINGNVNFSNVYTNKLYNLNGSENNIGDNLSIGNTSSYNNADIDCPFTVENSGNNTSEVKQQNVGNTTKSINNYNSVLKGVTYVALTVATVKGIHLISRDKIENINPDNWVYILKKNIDAANDFKKKVFGKKKW